MGFNLVSEYLTGSATARTTPSHLVAIHGLLTSGGKISIINGTDPSGTTVFVLDVEAGPISIEMAPDSWRLDQGCYVDFGGAAGSLTLSFH